MFGILIQDGIQLLVKYIVMIGFQVFLGCSLEFFHFTWNFIIETWGRVVEGPLDKSQASIWLWLFESGFPSSDE